MTAKALSVLDALNHGSMHIRAIHWHTLRALRKARLVYVVGSRVHLMRNDEKDNPSPANHVRH